MYSAAPAAAALPNSALPAFFATFAVFLEIEGAGVLVVGLVAVMMNVFAFVIAHEFVY